MRRKRKSRRTGLALTAVMVLLICGIVSLKRQELDQVNAKIYSQDCGIK